jgi:diaminohydroxyphosphoribosylaminopyrimidine deaminase/5-amino-6-(5-phosphoribosylamino)uracil reductase
MNYKCQSCNTTFDAMQPEIYMQRCLQLAALGLGHVAPNPLVGCVLVYNDKIIAEGFHQAYGLAHAEVNAIAKVSNDINLKNTTLYVNLEPCAHYGKTPPCVNLIIDKGIQNVVIATKDPFEKVNGNGVKMLTDAGVNVTVGLLENEALFLNRRFITFYTKKRPYIILKWAQSSDGFIARKKTDLNYTEPDVISNTYSQRLSHLWRMQESAIAVGFKTALVDNPQLNVRYHRSTQNPARIVIDKNLELPYHYHLLNNKTTTLVFNSIKQCIEGNIHYIKIKTQPWLDVLQYMYNFNLQSVIIEGGAATHQWFIDNNLWDEARIITSDQPLFEGLKAPHLLHCFKNKLTLKNNCIYTYYNNSF